MKVAIITYVAQESSRQLAKALVAAGIKAEAIDMNRHYVYDGFTHVFGYGCSSHTGHRNRLNTAKATKVCIDKVETFKRLQRSGINIPDWTASKRIAMCNKWSCTVVRTERTGRKAEGLELIDYPDRLPEGELFTEYFYHKYEYRIVVFNGEVVGRYYKKRTMKKGEAWHTFVLQPQRGFDMMDDHCVRAAKALGIDYVGFDVVANTKKDFKILEANSGPILTDEAEAAIIKYFKGKK
jgi:hypothetical protein